MSDLAANAGEVESSDLLKIDTAPAPTEDPFAGLGVSDSEVSAEELMAYVDERFGSTPETDLQTPDEGTQLHAVEDEVEPEITPDPEPQPEPQPTGLTPDQIQAYQQFDGILKSNPALSQLVTGVLTGDISLDQAQEIAQQVTVPPAETPPPDLDLDDPAVKHLYDQSVAQARELQALNERLSNHDDFLNRQRQETSASLVNRAKASFQQRMELDDVQMGRLEQIAAGLQILPALAQGFNPSTGQYESPDTLAAVERALEVAYWTQPETREREFQRQVSQRATDNKRKQKLAAVSGNSGSVPRSLPAPQTQEGRRQAMIQEVATAMSGNTVTGD